MITAILLLSVMAACYFVGRHSSSKEPPVAAGANLILYYVDPMHPAYRSSKPGIAPDCGMELVPVYEQGLQSALPPGSVHIDAQQEQLAGIRGEAVELANTSNHLRVFGKVMLDDRRVSRITAGASGWIRETFDGSTGSYVKKGQRLASFYSQDFIALEQGYLVATERSLAGMKTRDTAPGTQSTSARLRNMGMGDGQIEEMAKTRQVPESIDIVAPTDGFIVARSLSPGQRFEPGTEFYRIADIGHVWIEADIVQEEAPEFKHRVSAVIEIPHQTKTLRALVSDGLPHFDPLSRTMKLRLEAENPGYLLRPDMLVNVDLPDAPNVGLSIPVDAIVDTGMQQQVFVDLGGGYFAPRTVQTGWRTNGRVEIKSGLKAGERVVVEGTFLLNSESRLREDSQVANNSHENTYQSRVNAGAPSPSLVHAPVADASVTKDPQCGMSVKIATSIESGNSLRRNGKLYYFCSQRCRDRFTSQADKFMAMSSAGGQR